MTLCVIPMQAVTSHLNLDPNSSLVMVQDAMAEANFEKLTQIPGACFGSVGNFQALILPPGFISVAKTSTLTVVGVRKLVFPKGPEMLETLQATCKAFGNKRGGQIALQIMNKIMELVDKPLDSLPALAGLSQGEVAVDAHAAESKVEDAVEANAAESKAVEEGDAKAAESLAEAEVADKS